MCGIITGFGDKDKFFAGLKAAEHRGPDNTGHLLLKNNIFLGHTRLTILDVTDKSNQPFKAGKVSMTYNGELWNYKTLREELKAKGKRFVTTGDTEVMAKSLEEWGVEALKRLDGMYGVVWWDGKVLRAARDIFGEVPLYYSPTTGWAGSEEKILRSAGIYDPTLLEPGYYVELSPEGAGEPIRFDEIKQGVIVAQKKAAGKKIRKLLKEGSVKKTISDVPVCCLLSGGIDSSFILRSIKETIPNVVAYTAVFNKKSADLKRTREVAEYLDVKLVEVPVPLPTKEDLAEVVRIIEIPHKAQVEIGWACLNLAKQMKKDGFKVTFSGEGADEMFGSYGFSYHAIKEGKDWGEYRHGLFSTQHRKNFLRCNKIFMSQGVECRLPFLHKPLVEYVTSLSLEVTGKDKQPLKEAARGLLPDSVVDRPKVAFQDGLGLKKAITTVLNNPKAFYTEQHKMKYPAPMSARKGIFF